MNALSTNSKPFWAPVVIRLATAGDQRSLERLAQMDSTQMPGGQIVLGELHGRPVVAISLTDGRLIADPFVATGEIVELARLRARQLGEDVRSGHSRPGKAPARRTKRMGGQIGSLLPMYRRLSELILRTT